MKLQFEQVKNGLSQCPLLQQFLSFSRFLSDDAALFLLAQHLLKAVVLFSTMNPELLSKGCIVRKNMSVANIAASAFICFGKYNDLLKRIAVISKLQLVILHSDLCKED